MKLAFVLLFAFATLFATCVAEEEVDDNLESIEKITPCFPSTTQLVKRANENCTAYAERVCLEAKQDLKNCSLSKCEAETALRCPFRDAVRARANRVIRKLAEDLGIWEEHKAEAACLEWFEGEKNNVTRLAAVWDMLHLLPCPEDELTIRNEKLRSCFKIETTGVGVTHPQAKYCYNTVPIDLGIGAHLAGQCCYGHDLKLLVRGNKGSGSVQLSGKLATHPGADIDHFQEDVLPYLKCCALSNHCDRLSVVRPAHLKRETPEETFAACSMMVNSYNFKPYKEYGPPYVRPDVIASLAGKNDTLARLVELAQVARNRIFLGLDPYEKPTTTTTHTTEEETTHAKPTTHPAEEEHSTTKKPAAHTTEEETTHAKPTTHPAEEEHSTTKKPAVAHTTEEEATTHAKPKPTTHATEEEHATTKKPAAHTTEEEATHAKPTTHPTEEEHATTKKPAAHTTEEEATHSKPKPTTHAAEEEHSTTKHATGKPETRSEIVDHVIADILKRQTHTAKKTKKGVVSSPAPAPAGRDHDRDRDDDRRATARDSNRMFDSMDLDRRGFVTFDQVSHEFHHLTRAQFNSYDLNKNGKLTKAEFAKLFAKFY